MESFGKLVAANVVAFAVLQFIATTWLKARLEASLRDESNTRQENLRFALRQKEQAAMIAALLAEWSANSVDKKRLNQLAWEAALWLPEDEARELSKTLSHGQSAKSAKDILIAVRKHMKGAEDGLTAAEIVHFP